MKKIKIIIKKIPVLLAVLLLSLGCSNDILQQTNPNSLSEDSFWQTAQDAELALIATYSTLNNILSYGRMMNLQTTLRSDIIRPYEFSCCYNPGNWKNDPNDGRTYEVWIELWKTVFRSNNILANVPDIDMDEAQKNSILGQAYFLRAYVGFLLMNMWENVPFTTEPAESLEDFFPSQIGPDQIRPILISDLQQAKALLPNSWPESEVGKATSAAATALLGKVYLYNQQWGSAAAELKEVIEGQHGSYDLYPNYAELFTSDSGDNSNEGIFELQMNAVPGTAWGSDALNSNRSLVIQHDMAPPGFTNQTGLRMNQWVFDLFLEEQTLSGETDPRALATMVWNYPGAMIYNTTWADAVPIINNSISGAEDAENGADANDLAFNRKYLLFGPGFNTAVNPSLDYNGINYKIIRFADVLLMYAEAENEINGGSADALSALNRVRSRANMAPSTAADQTSLRDAIRRERVLELANEGDRFQDLKRWGLLADRFAPGDPNDLRFDAIALDFVPGKHERLPIPQNDVDTNPNLNQNPGY